MGLYAGFCGCLRRNTRESEQDADGTEDSLFFKLEELHIATNFFSGLNQLGHGGFGPVYKGLLKNGQEIAVKKLSLNSRQGVPQFINEVKLLLRVQHRNLVMLLGCCAEGPEKILVYEFLPNSSLDHFLFDKKKSLLLDWTKRFRIVKGIVSGLLYLHEEAPERIIHRDIKASNILLDEHLNPKIADFGLARLFPGEDTHLEASKIAGTRGYMAPEYAMHGYLCVKTDVFSLGILILEIVSGRKNHDGSLGAGKADLLNHAWILFQTGRSLELVDASLQKYNPEEAAMCIHLGLLCCQASVTDRPEMNSIQLTLLSNSFTLPTPGKPGIQGRAGRWTTTTNSSDAFTTNTDNMSMRTTKDSEDSGIMNEYSRNSISYTSLDEGR